MQCDRWAIRSGSSYWTTLIRLISWLNKHTKALKLRVYKPIRSSFHSNWMEEAISGGNTWLESYWILKAWPYREATSHNKTVVLLFGFSCNKSHYNAKAGVTMHGDCLCCTHLIMQWRRVPWMEWAGKHCVCHCTIIAWHYSIILQTEANFSVMHT